MKFFRDMEADWTIQNDKSRHGIKEHAPVDIKHDFVLATTITPASHHDSHFLPYCTEASYHTEKPINKVYADNGYYGEPDRTCLHINQIKDNIMRKDTTTVKLMVYEKERKKDIKETLYR